MPGWFVAALLAFLWLAIAALVRPVSGRVRVASLAAAAGWAGLAGVAPLWHPAEGALGWVGWCWGDWLGPIAALLGVYATAAAHFTGPQIALERWLLEVDRRIFAATCLDGGLRRAPRWLIEGLELGYLLAYPLVPLGAWLLLLDGQAALLPRYWTVVVSSGIVCYAALPLLRTRPPRSLEPEPAYGGRPLTLRRVNLALLSHVSSQVNTLPSGHAATAVAILLVLGSYSSVASAVVAPIVVALVIATVTGRYHFTVDTVLGVIVALGVWFVLG